MTVRDAQTAPTTLVNSVSQGHLYVVATPIGNLGDISTRAVQTLEQADYIAAEDTRHSARLLAHFNITTPQIAYHDHSDAARLSQLLDYVRNGQSVALISDAGTPLISDPGFRLVKAAREHGLSVIPIPGASAIITALSAAGLPSDRWVFEGFLPAKRSGRLQRLQQLSSEQRTLVFYESTHRICDCLADMAVSFGSTRQAVIARELTKTFETILNGTFDELIAVLNADANQKKGEFVVLVEGAQLISASIDAQVEQTMRVLLEELSIKQASAIGAKLTGLKKRDLYQWALDNKETI